LILTRSQNLNPRSTSCFGYFTPGNVSSQISNAISFASFTPSAFGSRTLVRLLICVSASRYTLASTPNPVFTSVWKGNEIAMSKRSSRVRRASDRSSIFSDTTSSSVRNARVSDRTNELNTSSSRDSGADHGCAYKKKKTKQTVSRWVRTPTLRAGTYFKIQGHDAQHSHHQQHARFLIVCNSREAAIIKK
jgi:hypothetical protein